jgi:drug/metabolite transporter (DMT)-like permease
MTLILLALGSAVVYGAADFFGGAASRRVPARSVLLVSLPIGLVVLVVAALAAGDGLTRQGLAWGLAAGAAGGSGLLVFYRALARGPMSVVAPIAALVSALLPVAAGLARGERLAPSVLVGVVVCLVAICLVSMEEGGGVPGRSDGGPGERHRRLRWAGGPRQWARGPWRSARGLRRWARGPVLAAVSGVGFGVFFILLSETGRHGGLWALAASRAAGLTVVIAVALGGWALMRLSTPATKGVRFVPPGAVVVDRATLVIAAAAGTLDSLANVLYMFATRAGMLSLAAVLTSMYPAITVLLARVVYSERLRSIQRLGVVLALAGVALVTVG